MSVTYLIVFDVKPERREEFHRLLSGVLDAMRNETTFREAILHRDPQSESRFMLYETWESHDDVMTNQINRPYREAWHAALPELLNGPREISVWEPIRADRQQG
ncbi:putative quinol monooxygenase [Rhodoligotrophos ferricapiens]|uniref:putative quinol monooxygenase n=1 Tax=Rhodoligotrophos ferricapiens TaxID=3069264 RepID=UPI00315CF9DB